MSTLRARSDYFKMICNKNKLIADGRPLTEDTFRKSFHRINSEQEFMSACVNWIHLPCCVHIGNDWMFNQEDGARPRETTINQLHFFSKADNTTYPFDGDAIQAAYDEAALAMKQFVAYMIEDLEANGRCGHLFLFDVNRAKATKLEPVNENLYGWALTFMDTQVSFDMVYNSNNWFTD